MKIYEVYSIRDDIAETYAPPFIAENDGVAIRAFGDGQSKQMHPEDYSLYLIGQYDPFTGHLIPREKPILITDNAIMKKAEAHDAE